MLEPLAKAIRQIPGGKTNNRPIGLRIDSGSFGVIAREGDEANYEELRIPMAEIKGKPITVFLNRDYLVKALSFGMNRIELIDGMSPVRCASKTEFMIIMPVRQTGEVRVGHSSALTSAPMKDKAVCRQEKVPATKPVSPAV